MIQPIDVVLIPLITGLIAMATGLGMPKKFNPLLAIVLGVTGGVFYVYPSDLKEGILYGVVFGLSSVGLYSGTKNVKEGMEK